MLLWKNWYNNLANNKTYDDQGTGYVSLTLYHFMGCPYCQRVRDFLDKEGISVPMKDTHENPAYRDELIKIGGKSQVPCLVIDGKASL